MKKVILSALTFFMLSTVAVFAQDVNQDRPATTHDQEQPAADTQEMRTEVQLHELPEAVTNTLMKEDYQEWTPSSSYVVTDETTGEEKYAVDLQKDDEIKTVYFDNQGNKLDKDKNKNKDKNKDEDLD